MLKEVFDRLRPFEVIAKENWDSQFFVSGGSSFPSGHAAHFWALIFLARFDVSALSSAFADNSRFYLRCQSWSKRSLVERRFGVSCNLDFNQTFFA